MKIQLGGFFTLTFLVLLTLKLTDLCEISWFWVFFPLLGGLILLTALFVAFGLGILYLTYDDGEIE